MIITIAFAVTFLGFAILFFHGNYDAKILAKLGVQSKAMTTDWAVVGWNNTMEKLDYDADVVFFGDSIICGSDFREYFPEKKIVNLGYPGDTLIGMKQRIPAIIALSPKKVFVLGGINGLTDANIDMALNEYCDLLKELKTALPMSEIYVQSVLPISQSKERMVCHNTTIVEFNQSLEWIAVEQGMTYVDLYSLYELDGQMNSELSKDGIHLWPEAYGRWADAIKGYMD